jgi:Ca-activated chloride channel family protein
MNFEHLKLIPLVGLAFLILFITVFLLESRFFKMVRTYWFYKRSTFSIISSILFCLGMGLLFLSLLDLRGPEEKIKAGVPTERTIILIDTSASMLAEDVKPSRLQKAVLVAKHFARKATGQQISIVAFAEIQKKIVPFTNDLDLIDARLESIKNLRNQNGSSALSSAIQESIQYFKETGEARGNILVITDGEETAVEIDLDVPKDIHVALVGVGTTQGGRIPLDDSQGFRFGYKKYRGQDIITKLNETFFKKISSDLPSGEYWLANTYNFPTEEILDFFKGEKQNSEKQQDMVIKPVMMEYLVLPALLLLALSYLLKSIKIFTLGLLLVLRPGHAAEEIQFTPDLQKKMIELQGGKLNQLERIKLADDLQKAGAKDEALSLYEENLSKMGTNKVPDEAYLNYGTGLLEKGEVSKGLAIYEELNKRSNLKPEIREMMNQNVATFFKSQEEKKKQQKKDDKKDNQDKNDKGQNQSGAEGSKQEKNSKGNQQNKSNPENGENQDNKDKNKEDKKEENKQDEKNKDEKEKQQEQESEQNKKKLPAPKLEPKLKQLMSDDRQLQLKMIEQGTREMNRRKNRENKDW